MAGRRRSGPTASGSCSSAPPSATAFPVGSVYLRANDGVWGVVDADPIDGADEWVASIAVDDDGWHSFDPFSAAFIQVRWEIAGNLLSTDDLSMFQGFYGFELKLSALSEGSGRDGRGT